MAERRLEAEVILTGDEQVKRKLKEIEKAGETSASRIVDSWERSQRRAVKISDSFISVGKSLTVGLTLPIVAAGAGLIKLGMDAQETRSLIAVSFGSMTSDIQAWANNASASIVQTKLETQRQAAVFFNMANGMGLARNESYRLATQMTNMSADFASFFNLRPEEAFIKLSAAITGEFEPLKRLGIVLNQEIIKQQAYKDGIAQVGEQLDQTQKVLATYNAIVERAGPAMGDLVRTQDSLTNQLRTLKARGTEAAQALGEGLVPAAIEALTAIRPLIDGVADLAKAFTGLSPERQKGVLILLGALAAVGPTIVLIGNLTKAIISLGVAFRYVSGLMPIFAANLTATGAAVRLGLAQMFGVGTALGAAWQGVVVTAAGIAMGGLITYITRPDLRGEIAESLSELFNPQNLSWHDIQSSWSEAISDLGTGMKEDWNTVWGWMQDIVIAKADSIEYRINEHINRVKKAYYDLQNYLVGNSIWPDMWESMLLTVDQYAPLIENRVQQSAANIASPIAYIADQAASRISGPTAQAAARTRGLMGSWMGGGGWAYSNTWRSKQLDCGPGG